MRWAVYRTPKDGTALCAGEFWRRDEVKRFDDLLPTCPHCQTEVVDYYSGNEGARDGDILTFTCKRCGAEFSVTMRWAVSFDEVETTGW
jgi:transcription elongation factor Elf1